MNSLPYLRSARISLVYPKDFGASGSSAVAVRPRRFPTRARDPHARIQPHQNARASTVQVREASWKRASHLNRDSSA